MTKAKNPSRPPEQQGDGQPENVRELQDPSGGAAHDKGQMESSGMGGTSDAGGASDDAAEAAAFDRGLPDDRTRGGGSGE